MRSNTVFSTKILKKFSGEGPPHPPRRLDKSSSLFSRILASAERNGCSVAEGCELDYSAPKAPRPAPCWNPEYATECNAL